MEIIAERMRTGIYLNTHERENLQRRARARRRAARRALAEAELRAELGRETLEMGALRRAVFSALGLCARRTRSRTASSTSSPPRARTRAGGLAWLPREGP